MTRIEINRVGRLETMDKNTTVKIIGNQEIQIKDNNKPRWSKIPPKNCTTGVKDVHQVISFT